MKELVLEYSTSREQQGEDVQASFADITVDLAKQQETFGINVDRDHPNAVPSTVKRYAVEMFHLLKRSREEKDILGKEMKAVFNYFVKEEEKLAACVAALILSGNSGNRYEAGAIALLKAEQKLLQIRISSIHDNFKECVNLPCIEFPEVQLETETDDDDST